MAILRGGKRIGGYDVRIGIPRDRSLDNVSNDPRFRQRTGGNPESTMGRFQAMVNEAEGFARKARYYVEYQLPKGIPNITPLASEVSLPTDQTGKYSDASLESQYFPSQSELLSVQQANSKRVQAFCNSISMPERTAITKDIKHNGPKRKFVYDYSSAPITASFYADKFLRERSYFELWQQSAFSTTTHNYNFYDNYVSDINIFQLGQFASRQERDDVTYAVKLFDCYPKTISTVDYSHADGSQVQTFTVTFDFRYWINYFIDRQGNIELGQANFRDATVKQAGGLFGGLLGKLPPELRRAGRGVIEDLRRRIPIGRATGGRVFPPFKIPPLNI
jgi:hypothetical protein